MNPVIVRIFVTTAPDPGEKCFVQVLLEEHEPVVKHWLGVVFIEGYEKADDRLLLVRGEF